MADHPGADRAGRRDAVTLDMARASAPLDSAFAANRATPRSVKPGELALGRSRLVVLSPQHGDDVLRAGGSIAALLRERLALTHIVVTQAASARWGDWWTRGRLRRQHRDEARQAIAVLGARRYEQRHWAMLPGRVAGHEGIVAARLLRTLLPTDLLLAAAPIQHSPDAVALHAAVLRACASTGAGLILWAAGANSDQCHRVVLSEEDLARKRVALATFRSYLLPDPRSARPPAWEREWLKTMLELPEYLEIVASS